MVRINRHIGIFSLILLQTVLCISIGLVIFYTNTVGRIPANVFIDEVAIGGLREQEASKKLDEYYTRLFETKKVYIHAPQAIVYPIKYSDIDVKLDEKGTLEKVFGKKKGFLYRVATGIKGSFSTGQTIIKPEVDMDSEKLKSKLKELAVLIEKEPKSANIRLDTQGGVIIKTEEEDGRGLHMENAANKIAQIISSGEGRPVEFIEGQEIIKRSPEYSLDDFKGIDGIVAEHTTVADHLGEEGIIYMKFAAHVIDRLVYYNIDINSGGKAEVFSFNERLNEEEGIRNMPVEGYNVVASTLNAALIKAGIKEISVTHHKTPVNYIDPGLDAVVLGKEIDYQFKNTLDYPIAIFARVDGNKVTVWIGGKKDAMGQSGIESQIEQRIKPQTIHVGSANTPKEAKETVVEGKEGYVGKVYRLTQGKKEEIYSFRYEPLPAMVEAGTSNPQEKVNAIQK